MSPRRYRRRPDLFSVLVIFVLVGMGLTLAYQIDLFYGGEIIPIARQAPPERAFNTIGG